MRLFLVELFLFSVTLLLGILVSFRLDKALVVEGSVAPMGAIFLYFILATLFILFFIKKGGERKTFFFRLAFYLAVFFGGLITLSSFLENYAFIFLFLLLFIFTVKPIILVHNICIIIGISGVGAMAGLSFLPQQIAIFMVLLSFYDVIAVYKTKHMIKMAKEMIAARSLMGMIIPFHLRDFLSTSKKFFILGGGDVMIPLIFAVSFVPQNSVYPFVIFLFSILGLFFSFLIFISLSRPIPALPPIVLFLLLGYLFIELQVLYHIGIL